MVVYGVSAVAVFLVVLWFTRRALAPSGVEVPRWWRVSGWLVWISLLFGGFSGVSQLTAPLLSGLSASAHDLASGALFGAVVALVVQLGAALAMHADMGMWKWAVLFQVIALGGDLLAAGATGVPAYAVAAVIPALGLFALAMAFRTPPQRSAPSPPPRTKRR
jgi:hypothetical protein